MECGVCPGGPEITAAQGPLSCPLCDCTVMDAIPASLAMLVWEWSPVVWEGSSVVWEGSPVVCEGSSVVWEWSSLV